MSKWIFAPSSELYLQRCIAAAAQPDLGNKWYQKLGMNDSPVVYNSTQNIDNGLKNHSLEVGKEESLLCFENFFNTIESESTVPLQYIMKECNKNPDLVTIMAKKLTISKVEQLFVHIFHQKVDSIFLATFIINFLPTYFKLYSSRLCVDLLVKLDEVYPQIFQELLKILINNTELPNQVLKNYIAALNENSLTSFMQKLSSIELSLEGFIHNVLVIYLAYKDCIKNDQNQNYIQRIIVQHGKGLSTDRNFGRLFLTYLQSEKALKRNVSIQILECLEAHRSPFKRPCSMLLKEI